MKQLIRKKLLTRRRNQSLRIKKMRDSKILNRLTHMKVFQAAREIFTYVDYNGEVETTSLIKRWIAKKRVVIPKVEKKSLCLFILKNADALTAGTFGIREPIGCLPHQAWHAIDLAIIPGVVFDLSGHRIGFGGGYFDRLLQKLDCTRVGLAYEFQIIDKVPTHAYDVPVDYIVTEKRIIICKKLRPLASRQKKL